jgi:putative tricarboxylic transport membrane protein
MAKRELFSSIFFLALGMVFAIGSLRYRVRDPFGPGPGFFPFLLGILLCLFSLCLFFEKLIRKNEKTKKLEPFQATSLKKIVPYLCSLLFFYFFFNRLGFVLTIFVFMAGVLILLGKRSIRLSLSIAFLSSLFVYLIFIKLMSVSLPGGILQNIIKLY